MKTTTYLSAALLLGLLVWWPLAIPPLTCAALEAVFGPADGDDE